MKTYFGVRFAALAVLGLATMGARAEAATISLSPSAQNVDVGNQVSVDVMVGLSQGEVVGGAYLDLTFDNALIGAVSATNDPDVIMDSTACPSDPGFCDFSFGFGAGTYNLDLLADLAISEVDLGIAQGALFRLARLTFSGLVPGVALLDFLVVQLSNYDGSALLPLTSMTGGSITVNDDGVIPDPTPIPEPGTIALFGAGAAILLARRLRRA